MVHKRVSGLSDSHGPCPTTALSGAQPQGSRYERAVRTFDLTQPFFYLSFSMHFLHSLRDMLCCQGLVKHSIRLGSRARRQCMVSRSKSVQRGFGLSSVGVQQIGGLLEHFAIETGWLNRGRGRGILDRLVFFIVPRSSPLVQASHSHC